MDEDVEMTLTMNKCIRVLVVDDSAIVRKILTQELGRHPGIEIVGPIPNEIQSYGHLEE